LLDTGCLDEVFDFVGAVVDDDPFHPVFGVCLISETLEHGLYERSAVESGGAYRYERVELFGQFGCMCFGFSHDGGGVKYKYMRYICLYGLWWEP
jgi:hypothetical protein